jgi:ATP-dependent DNA helicase DinG
VQKLDSEQIINALCEGGSVASRLEQFEPRQAQLDLMELIIRCFNEDAIGAAEAGTGVGKSFAYLLPALHFTGQNKERVVLSTATINLQQQLFGKDIPLVQEALGSKVKSVLMKGRGNYLCFRRLEDMMGNAHGDVDLPFAEAEDELARIADWAKTSKSGSRDDLSFTPSEKLWSRVCSDADLCMGKHCHQQKRCFVQTLRKEAAAARIIVVNHHLLFADLVARHEGAGYESAVVLPPYSRVIIDEAHTIEDAATSFFSKEFSRVGIMRHLGRLYRRRRAARSGLLVRFCSLVSGGDKNLDALVEALDGIRLSAGELDSPALDFCASEGVFRFSPERENGSAESVLFPLFITLGKKLLAFTAMARELVEQLPQDALDDSGVITSCYWELKAILRRFENIAGICSAFTSYRERQGEVMWIERRGAYGDDTPPAEGGKYWAVFTQSPVELAESLKESLFSPNKTVVCVSATLAISGNFNYWAIRSGAALTKGRQLLSGCFPSPFPYSKAVLLAAPDDAPLPDEPEYQEFVDHSVGRLVAAANGSALVLFTSYQSLNSAWNAALPPLQSLGIRCLKQGDDDRSRLLQAFLSDTRSVLFATDSFWEGVDAPGDTLRLVILCRLPFRTPNDPVFEARREAIEKNGGNPFMELSLPSSVMKFKQGFGRLIRRSSDRGVVAVLDSRLIKKRYGTFFLESLPETRTSFSDFPGILRDIENFLFS